MINDGKVWVEKTVILAAPGGYACLKNEVSLDTLDQEQQYLRDPDAFAAAHFGLTKPEYEEWVNLKGGALCCATTKNGKLCRFEVLPRWRTSDNAAAWKKHHRQHLCKKHGGQTTRDLEKAEL